MLLKKENSCLLLIDAQEKLTPLVQGHEVLIKKCEWLIRLAMELDIPKIINEQYPKGLGKTVPLLSTLAPTGAPIEKVHFSCWREPQFKERLQALNKKQLVLIGIETHVCVLQTALDLLNANYEIFVVVDAVGSRSELDHKYGLKRMKQAGIELVTSEMVFFEWLEQAGTSEFKSLSQQFFKGDHE